MDLEGSSFILFNHGPSSDPATFLPAEGGPGNGLEIVKRLPEGGSWNQPPGTRQTEQGQVPSSGTASLETRDQRLIVEVWRETMVSANPFDSVGERV
jgi:hypothetical protein